MSALSEEERSQLFSDAQSAVEGKPTSFEEFFDLGFQRYVEEAQFVEVGPDDPKTPEMQLARDVIQAYWHNYELVQNPKLKQENGGFIATMMIVVRGTLQDDVPETSPLYLL